MKISIEIKEAPDLVQTKAKLAKSTVIIEDKKASNSTRNATKPVEKKQLSLDEQISQVYDEIHSKPEKKGKDEDAGFIGKHFQKLEAKKQAEEEKAKRKLLAQQRPELVEEEPEAPKKKGLLARAEEKLKLMEKSEAVNRKLNESPKQEKQGAHEQTYAEMENEQQVMNTLLGK